MSGSPRPVQRRKKRDSTTQALDHLNGLMNTQKRPTPIKTAYAPTPHPSRRLTYSGRQDISSNLSHLPSPKTLPSKPRRVPPTEPLTPRRTLRFSEPIPVGSTQGGSTRSLRHHDSPPPRHGIDEEFEGPSDEENPEETETNVGDAIHADDPQMGSVNQSEIHEPSDDEQSNEGEDEGPLQENDEVLDGEGLRSDVDLFSDYDNHLPFAQNSPSSSSGQNTPARVQSESPANSDIAQPSGDISNKQKNDTPGQPSDKQHSVSSHSSPTKRTSTIAVEITRTEAYSSPVSVTPDDHHLSDIPVTDDARIADQRANIEDTTMDGDSVYQPPEDSSSSVSSPSISSESDSQCYSVKTSPEASSPSRQSNKRKRATTSHQEATGQVNMQSGPKRPRPVPGASSLVSSKKRVREHRHSHSQEDPNSHHATQPVQEKPVTQKPTTQDEPAQEETIVREQDHRPERLEDSSWFREASNLNEQSSNWKKLIQRAHALENEARLSPTAEFDGIRHKISRLIEMYTNIIDNLTDGTGPSNHDVRTCALSLRKIAKRGRRQLEEVYNLSTKGSKDKGKYLVEGFEKHVIPLLVRLVLVCFQAYYARSRLFPEAKDHVRRATEVLLGHCDQIHGLIQENYVDCHAISQGIRLPLRQIIKSFDQRVKRSRLSETTEMPREWTDEEGHALVEGLQLFQGPNRYYQICEAYREGIGRRGMREVRRESERLYRRIFPQIRESVRTAKGRQEWGWLLKVMKVREL
ncbi:hypothetical protein BO94DRAFT_536372 [Aspergillus sclerotioniger CBS 115572]|uniref:Uncharacterized protein n=1 Tax=Aspergillus sclerotioniger CBS 115572 TaxID=1450535 RepID=A0A317WFA0_9EURO|nr:hypothetical protein BO94DRAFT_536372 [Aspergillus sclerotioniger CBS 115572]PWY83678.1 hypothetical protein BO94DRAFT_536372 [Aspergillus sclerotioniger CBS 115572]